VSAGQAKAPETASFPRTLTSIDRCQERHGPDHNPCRDKEQTRDRQRTDPPSPAWQTKVESTRSGGQDKSLDNAKEARKADGIHAHTGWGVCAKCSPAAARPESPHRNHRYGLLGTRVFLGLPVRSADGQLAHPNLLAVGNNATSGKSTSSVLSQVDKTVCAAPPRTFTIPSMHVPAGALPSQNIEREPRAGGDRQIDLSASLRPNQQLLRARAWGLYCRHAPMQAVGYRSWPVSGDLIPPSSSGSSYDKCRPVVHPGCDLSGCPQQDQKYSSLDPATKSGQGEQRGRGGVGACLTGGGMPGVPVREALLLLATRCVT